MLFSLFSSLRSLHRSRTLGLPGQSRWAAKMAAAPMGGQSFTNPDYSPCPIPYDGSFSFLLVILRIRMCLSLSMFQISSSLAPTALGSFFSFCPICMCTNAPIADWLEYCWMALCEPLYGLFLIYRLRFCLANIEVTASGPWVDTHWIWQNMYWTRITDYIFNGPKHGWTGPGREIVW